MQPGPNQGVPYSPYEYDDNQKKMQSHVDQQQFFSHHTGYEQQPKSSPNQQYDPYGSMSNNSPYLTQQPNYSPYQNQSYSQQNVNYNSQNMQQKQGNIPYHTPHDPAKPPFTEGTKKRDVIDDLFGDTSKVEKNSPQPTKIKDPTSPQIFTESNNEAYAPYGQSPPTHQERSLVDNWNKTDADIRALNFELHDIGEIMAPSKQHIIWHFTINGVIHKVELFDSVFTGRKRVKVDNQEVHDTGRVGFFGNEKFDYTHNIDGVDVDIVESEDCFVLY